MAKNKKSSTKTWLTRILSTFLLLVSLTLIFNQPIRDYFIRQKTNEYKITKISKNTIQKNKKQNGNFDFSQVEAVSTEAVLSKQWDAQQLPVIGGIAIPDLKINLPIFNGVDNVSLMYGAGTMKPNQIMGEGNYTLASHHIFGVTGASDVLFSPLDKAKEGMEIYITDKTNVYTYVINSVEVVTPESLYVIDDVPNQTEITLVTCTDAAATNRIVVKGQYKSSIAYESMNDKMVTAFGEDFNQYKK